MNNEYDYIAYVFCTKQFIILITTSHIMNNLCMQQCECKSEWVGWGWVCNIFIKME